MVRPHWASLGGGAVSSPSGGFPDRLPKGRDRAPAGLALLPPADIKLPSPFTETLLGHLHLHPSLALELALAGTPGTLVSLLAALI